MFKNIIDNVSVPLGKMDEPEEITTIVAFLASSEAKYITGSNNAVDGGPALTV